MKFSFSFLSTLLVLVTSTAAHPARDERRAAMINKQIAHKHSALMAEKLVAAKPTATKTLSPPPAGAASGLATSTATFGPGGFAGPLVGGSTITTIKANLTVPTVQIPPNGQTSGLQYGFAAWVGIQGTGALWQTGIFATVSGSNDPEYSLFYDWFPEGGAASFSNGFTFGAGDQIYMTVTAGSSTSGTALVEKVSTGETATVTLTGMSTIGGRSTGDFIVSSFRSSLVAAVLVLTLSRPDPVSR